MKKSLYSLIFTFIPFFLSGQNTTVEQDFLDQREQIRTHRIKSISKYKILQHRNETPRRKKIRTYLFDPDGNLTEQQIWYLADTFPRNFYVYTHNGKGEYISKKETFIDISGMGKSVSNWVLEYDHLGNKVKEELVNEVGNVETKNAWIYDSLGRLVEEFVNEKEHWLYEYDEENRIAKSTKWKKSFNRDTLSLDEITELTYDSESRVISTFSTLHFHPSFISLETIFSYDESGKLKTKEESRMGWSRDFSCNCDKKKRVGHTITTYTYDDNSFLIMESNKAIQYFYRYEYY